MSAPGSNRRTDRELVLAAQAGDRLAAQLLFARYDQYLHREAMAATGSPSDAAEVAAAARARAWEKLSTLRTPERFGPWLRTIIRTCAADEYRIRARATPMAELPEQMHEDDDLGELEERRQRGEHVQRAVGDLSDRDRQALTMTVVEELPLTAVATRFGITRNATYQLLHRARRRLHHAYLTPVVPADSASACRECAARTAAYVDGSAALSVRARVDAHVADCEPCGARLAAMSEESERCARVFVLVLPALITLLLLRRLTAGALVRAGAVAHAARALVGRGPGGAGGGSTAVAAGATTMVVVAAAAVAAASGAFSGTAGSTPSAARAPVPAGGGQSAGSGVRGAGHSAVNAGSHLGATAHSHTHGARRRPGRTAAATVPVPSSAPQPVATVTTAHVRASVQRPVLTTALVAAAGHARAVTVSLPPPSVTIGKTSTPGSTTNACALASIWNCRHSATTGDPRVAGAPSAGGGHAQPGESGNSPLFSR